jgi:hypothetical protein
LEKVVGRGEKAHLGAGLLAVRVAHDLQVLDRLAAFEAGVVFLAVAPDAQLQPVRQRVDHRDAHAVQTAGDLVGVLVELPAGVQLGHDDLGGGDALFLVDSTGMPRPLSVTETLPSGWIVTVTMSAWPRQRLVDAVVDHLVDHVVQARAVVGVADIHAGALANGLQGP